MPATSGINSLLDLFIRQPVVGANLHRLPQPSPQAFDMPGPGPNAATPQASPQMMAEANRLRALQAAGPDAMTTAGYPGGFNEWARAAIQPGNEGYFNYDQGNITPKQFSPQQVANQAGISVGQLGSGFGPRGILEGSGNVNYQIPNDRGGFFTAQDLYGGNLPSVFERGSGGLSTNNWRLLGMPGPGYIMRNGQIIDVGAARHSAHGFPSSGAGGTASAEHGSGFSQIALGTGASQGAPNRFMGSAVGWPGSMTPWWQYASGQEQ